MIIDSTLYEVASLPKQYRIGKWKQETLIPQSSLDLMDDASKEVIMILVDEIAVDAATLEANLLLERVRKVIYNERRRKF